MKAALPNSRPLLVAHRGAMAVAPENSLASFDQALEDGAEGIELDVQLTADGVPVVFHDPDLRRITGRQGAISDYVWNDLRQLDFGRWFSEDYAGTKLLRLKDVLHLYTLRTRLFVELKSAAPGGRRSEKASRRLAASVCRMLLKHAGSGHPEGLYLLSFDAEMLEVVHRQAPGLKTILNQAGPGHGPEASWAQANAEALYGYGLPLESLEKSFTESMHAAGKKILVWSCNTTGQLDAALDAEADFIVSDDPAAIAPYFFHRVEKRKAL